MTTPVIPIPPSSAAANNNNRPSANPHHHHHAASDPSHDRLSAQFKSQMDQENAMLDQLHASVKMTEHKAKNIHQQFKDQDPMLNQLGDNIDHANLEISSQQRSVMDLIQDTKERSFWGTVAILVLVIIVLLWI